MIIMIVGVLLLVAVIGFVVFRNIMKQIAQGQVPPPPVVVTAMQAARQEWQPQLNAVGSLRAVRGVDVTTEIAGLVREIRFKSGDEVKAGAVLIQLNADSDLAQLASLKAAADLAQITLTRDRAQLAAQAISQAQVDSDEADLKSKRAQAASQQATIDKKTIRAPFSGRLGITLVNPGQYLNPGDKVVTLQTIDPIYIDFNLPQQQISGVSRGSDGDGVERCLSWDSRFSGKVTAIDAKVDTATRNVQVEATLPNPKKLLLPGMFATRRGRFGREEDLSDPSPDGHHLQPVRRNRVHHGRQEGRQGQSSGPGAAGVRHPGTDARRSGRDPEGRVRGSDGRHERTAQIEERHAAAHRQ